MAKRETITNTPRSRAAEDLARIRDDAKAAAQKRIAELNSERERVVGRFADKQEEAEDLFRQAEELSNKAKAIKHELRSTRDVELMRIDAELSNAAAMSGGRFLSDATA